MKNILFYILITFTLNIYCQEERQNAELPKIQIIPTKILTKAKGFSLNESGQWNSVQNKIPFPNYTKHQVDNFASYNLRDIIINDTMYYFFIKKFNTGWFTYPTLMEG